MNIKLKFKKYILIGLIVAFIPASLNAAWYHSVATSFKENLVAIASIAVGSTAILGTLWYMKNRAQKKEYTKSSPPKKTTVKKDDQSALQAELKEARSQIAFLLEEQTGLTTENQRLRQECQRTAQAQAHPQTVQPSARAACTNCAGHEETIQRWSDALNGVIGERDSLRTKLTQSQRAHQVLQSSNQSLSQQAQQHQSALATAKRDALMLEKENAAAQRTLTDGQHEVAHLKAENSKLTQAMNDAKRKAQADIDPLLAKIAGLEKIQATQDRELNATKAALKTANEKFTQQGAAYQRTIAQLTQLQNAELKLYEERAAKRTADLQANHYALTLKYNALLSRITNSPAPQLSAASAGGAVQQHSQSAAAVKPAQPKPNVGAAAAAAAAPVGQSRAPSPKPLSQNPFARLSE